MPLATQAKLLRVLEDSKVRRLGATKEQQVDVRMIAATNQGLEKAIQEGQVPQRSLLSVERVSHLAASLCGTAWRICRFCARR